MVVVKEGEYVKRATGWKKIWNNSETKKKKGEYSVVVKEGEYSVYIPTYEEDPNFIPLGVFCTFGKNSNTCPVTYNAALVHNSLCESVTLGKQIWKDSGTRATHEVTLNQVPVIHTMWPSVATLLGNEVPKAHTLKQCTMTSEKFIYKIVNFDFKAGSDAGSGAKIDLTYYEYRDTEDKIEKKLIREKPEDENYITCILCNRNVPRNTPRWYCQQCLETTCYKCHPPDPTVSEVDNDANKKMEDTKKKWATQLEKIESPQNFSDRVVELIYSLIRKANFTKYIIKIEKWLELYEGVHNQESLHKMQKMEKALNVDHVTM